MTPKEPKFRSVGKVLTAGADNTVYTCPPNYVAKVVMLLVANRDALARVVNIRWSDVSASESYYIASGFLLTANNFLKIDTGYFVLNPGDTIIINPVVGSLVNATVTVEEYYDPTQR